MREGPGITENKRYAEHSDLDAAFEPCRSYNELQAEGSQYWFVQDGDSVYFESFFPQLDASDLRDQNIKSLSIYEDVSPASQRPWSQHSRRHPRRVVGESLGPISLFLEKLSASYIIEANDFFRKTQSDWVWENLTSLTLTSELLAEDGCHLRATNMLANAAGAALQMPRLQRMEIWYGGFRTAALFRYAVSESGTSIRWHGTWELQLQRRLVDAWRAVAELHTTNELVVRESRFLDGSGIASREGAIQVLDLSENVVHPASFGGIGKGTGKCTKPDQSVSKKHEDIMSWIQASGIESLKI
ncbi:hypothetical protein CGCVW01_v014352 [Colletotrichum viniferum]|nr:hypothetical protein CGCVW01_v014352 [Colletotrichum viniferum]